jgi:DNA-binding NarL/FixJ family response regulator
VRAILLGGGTDLAALLHTFFARVGISLEIIDSEQRLLRMVEQVAPGDFLLFDCSTAVPRDLVECAGLLLRAAVPPTLPSLSPREQEVLALLTQGNSDTWIATSLNLSPGTVKRYVARIKDKWGLATRSEVRSAGLRMTRHPRLSPEGQGRLASSNGVLWMTMGDRTG